MKTISKILLVALCVTMLFALVGCSSTFGKIKKSFEAAEWEYVEAEDADGLASTTIEAVEDGELECTVHAFKKDGLLGINAYAVILEFKSDKELNAALEDNETLKGLIKDAQDSDIVNGNCVCIPVSITMIDEILDAFNESK